MRTSCIKRSQTDKAFPNSIGSARNERNLIDSIKMIFGMVLPLNSANTTVSKAPHNE